MEQDDRRGFSFLVERIAPLEGALGRARARAEDGARREAVGQ